MAKATKHSTTSFIANAIKHKGRLTNEVGGKPSKNLGKVKALASKGDKSAAFYLDILRPIIGKNKKGS